MLKRPISKNYPMLMPLIQQTKIGVKNVSYLKPTYRVSNTTLFKKYRVYKSQSPLMRKLGTTDVHLQQAKIHNLSLALPKLNNLVIKPNQTFSFWKAIGNPNYRNGYVDGMLLADGKVISGVGGGLCQIANMTHWLCLHTEMEVIEHWHHDYDIFPDNGRTIPFGSGAGVLYNYFDLQYYNPTKETFTLSFELSEKYLLGQVWSNHPQEYKFKIIEEDHKFYRTPEGVYRQNNLYKAKIDKKVGNMLDKKLILHNNKKVLYTCDFV